MPRPMGSPRKTNASITYEFRILAFFGGGLPLTHYLYLAVRSGGAMATFADSPERKEGDEWTMVNRVSEVGTPRPRTDLLCWGLLACFCLRV